MPEIEVVNELNHNYLIIKVDKTNDIDYQTKMIKNKNIDGLLKLVIQQINNKLEFVYEISNAINIDSMYENTPLRRNDIESILLGYFNMLDICDEYMIDKSCIMLLPQLIFIRNKKPVFCLYTKINSDIIESFLQLLDWMLAHVDYNDEKAVSLIYKINAKTVQEGFDSNSIKELISNKYHKNTNDEKRKELWENLIENSDKVIEVKDTKTEVISDIKEKSKQIEIAKYVSLRNILTFLAVVTLVVCIVIMFGVNVNFKMIIGAFVSVCMIIYVLVKNKEKIHLIKDNLKQAKEEYKTSEFASFDI